MLLDRQGRLFGKVNIIDLLIVLVVILAVVFFAVKHFDGDVSVSTGEAVRMEFYAEEVPDYSANAVKIGDPLTDDTGNIHLGVVTDVTVAPAVSYATDDQGNVVVSEKPGYSSIRITGEGNGRIYEHGVIISGSKYGIGHSFTLRAGMGKFWLRVSGISAVQ